MSQTRDQKCFTISEVEAVWHDLMIPWRIMRQSVARANERLESGSAVHHTDIPPPQSATPAGLHSIARKLLLIYPVPLRVGG